ncbi:pentatricopeptide repeat-containing protein At3g13880 [Cornus florida]|uniref:pentatricopeptide repeat-containing protein At3g13880 n=1 Tax=Cornus florida TaxID=4283 RepID=UPI00289AFECB|nr:pentatricopeptide repeat-containing protein At3g13880 [Cornus florida]XP_059630948.1 pentatricopeptide repeat-containing protein At3g13880 [Cornus florida]XP_059630949.1 pentatricopeptide repeat-containing protein At3g13880 [Cornus florida]XP_059630950.1 pentatricopeptide repeat-containing protein At3g13880 [Cornus florida]
MLLVRKPANFRCLSCVTELPELLLSNKTPWKKNYATTSSQPSRTPLPKYDQPIQLGLSLDSVTYTRMVQSSSTSGSLIHGKLAHAHMIKTGFNPCRFLQNHLINMYCKCGELDTARHMFDRMPKRNAVSWNSLISGYTQMGLYGKAIHVFNEARMANLKLDKFTYAIMLSVCAQSGYLELGKRIHGLFIVNGLGGQVFLANSLIGFYSKCGRLDQARVAFDNSDELDNVSWNSMIAGYVQSGLSEEMFQLLVRMHRCGMAFQSYVLGSVLKACCSSFDHSVECGRMLHGCAVKLGWDLDVVVGTALLDMYAKIGDPNDATLIFKLMPDKNVVMYNAMIAGLFRTENISDEFAREALNLFSEMQSCGIKPSEFTFSSIIKACNTTENFGYGKQIHAHICKYNLQSDEFIGSSLIELYSLMGSADDGVKCFNSTTKLNIVTWTSMIVGHVQNGQFDSALALFCELMASGIKPDEFTISSMLSVCANLAAARSGEQMQGHAIKIGINNFTIVQNSLIWMYAKSGDIDSANLAFEEMDTPDTVSWSVIIFSSAQYGCAREALRLFELMKGCGIAPNQITFLGVLTACSHGGLVEEGLRYFESMKKDHGIIPNEKHFTCIVDILGRAGRLADAENFIINSCFDDVPVMWRALLSACRVHKDTVTGERVAERVIELEPQVAASYVLLYNIYTEAELQMPAAKIRDLMKERGVKKEPGLSWIELGNKVHSFLVGDRSHPQSQIIYAQLEKMLEKIKKIGYIDEGLVPDASELDQTNSSLVNHHSEKLAVTLGIISLPMSAPVRVMKNLRVCRDCHTIMKFFSKVEKREIILRDSIRFHRFREGSCSCGDYW